MNASDKNEVIPSARLERWRRVWDILLASDEEPRASDERTESTKERDSKEESQKY